jgi:hypothetical protein
MAVGIDASAFLALRWERSGAELVGGLLADTRVSRSLQGWTMKRLAGCGRSRGEKTDCWQTGPV